MRLGVVGTGAVGARVARLLATTEGTEQVLVCGRSPASCAELVRSTPGTAPAGLVDLQRASAVVLATPSGTHWPVALQLLSRGVGVVSVSGEPNEVRGLLALDATARERGVTLVLGAAFSPGLTCVLAAHAAAPFDHVEAVSVARQGAGGPACARRYHAALGRGAWIRRDGAWVRRPGGSGRELCWFPDPVGPADCYFGALAEPQLLVRLFPAAPSITARRAADRQDRLTARLPMLSPPPPVGGLGAVRVGVRGLLKGVGTQRVLGAAHNPAAATAAVAAGAAVGLASGEARCNGAVGLAEAFVPLQFLSTLVDRGVTPAIFEGAGL